MKHLRLLGMESEREALLKAMQDMECVEISSIDGSEEALKSGFAKPDDKALMSAQEASRAYRTAHSGIALDDSIFTVGMTAGISICHILRYGGSHHRLILLKLLPKGRLWRFFLHLRLLGLDGIFFCQFLFSLDFVILRLFLFGKIAAFLDK